MGHLQRGDLDALKGLARTSHERELEDERATYTPAITLASKTCVCGAPNETWQGMPPACRALGLLIEAWLRR